MKHPRFWKMTLLGLVPLVLFAFVQERNSWRPKTIWQQDANRVNFSPGGRYLAIFNSGRSREGFSLLFYDVAHGKIAGGVKNVSPSSPCFLDSSHVALWSFGNQGSPGKDSTKDSKEQFCVYSVPEGHLVKVAPQLMNYFAVLADGKTLIGTASPYHADEFAAWDYQSPAAPHPALPFKDAWPLSKGYYEDAHLLADKQTLARCYRKDYPDYEIQFWDLNSYTMRFRVKTVPEPEANSSGYEDCEFISGTAKDVCAVYNDGYAEIWNYKTGQRRSTIYVGGLLPGVLSPDGDLLADYGLETGDVLLWDTKSGQLSRTLKPVGGITFSLDFSPDSRTLVTCTQEGTVQSWRIK